MNTLHVQRRAGGQKYLAAVIKRIRQRFSYTTQQRLLQAIKTTTRLDAAGVVDPVEELCRELEGIVGRSELLRLFVECYKEDRRRRQVVQAPSASEQGSTTDGNSSSASSSDDASNTGSDEARSPQAQGKASGESQARGARKRRRCVYCLCEATVTFSPCVHTVCCWKCGTQAKSCPKCNEAVLGRWCSTAARTPKRL